MFETHTPLIALFLLAPLWHRRAGSRGLFLILWAFAVGVLLAYLPYVYFQSWEWSYTRFLLPAIPVMWLLILTGAGQALTRAGAGATTLVTIPALLLLGGFSIVRAKERYVFELKDAERKYVQAADYVRHVLPPNAVLLSMQHSGSLWYYTRRPIVRWDSIEPRRFDETVAWVRANGYAPFIVADAEEFGRIKERFGRADQDALKRAKPVAAFGDALVYAFE